MAGYWPSSLFSFLWTEAKPRPISSYRDQTSLGNKGFITWHSTPSCRFVFLLWCLPVFVAKCILETHQHFCFLCFHSRWRFRFSRFPSSNPAEKSQKILSDILPKDRSSIFTVRHANMGGCPRKMSVWKRGSYPRHYILKKKRHLKTSGSFCLPIAHINGFVVSKEIVVLRRWESETKIWC